MSRSELHDWECAIEKLSGDNTDKMLVIAQDIYNTAFIRGKNYMLLEQTRWIPVNERLPDSQKHGDKDFSDWVEVTILIGINKKDTYVGEAYYCFSENKWYAKRFVVGEVIAWMPLPEPYKAESEE